MADLTGDFGLLWIKSYSDLHRYKFSLFQSAVKVHLGYPHNLQRYVLFNQALLIELLSVFTLHSSHRQGITKSKSHFYRPWSPQPGFLKTRDFFFAILARKQEN